ncbi:MAG: SRPBCC domain-containing protein [Candidatus Xenobia bacterium]
MQTVTCHETMLLDAAMPLDSSRVFALLTRPEELTRWYSSQAELEPAAGASGRFEGKDGRFLESWLIEGFEPERRVLVDWKSQADWYADLQLHVDCELEALEPSKCRLQVRARGEGCDQAWRGAMAEWTTALEALVSLAQAEATVRDARDLVRIHGPRVGLMGSLHGAAVIGITTPLATFRQLLTAS